MSRRWSGNRIEVGTGGRGVRIGEGFGAGCAPPAPHTY